MKPHRCLPNITLLLLTVFLTVVGTSCSSGTNPPEPNGKSAEKSILSFRFVAPPVGAQIDQATRLIWISVPHGTPLGALVPLIELSPGASVDPPSGSPLDFSFPVVFRVTAEDGSANNYLVSVKIAAPDAKSLDSFGIVGGIAGGVDQTAKTAWACVSNGIALNALTPVFTFTGSAVSNGGTGLVSGIGTVDFSTPQVFTIHAADGTVESYTISISNASASKACDLLSFTLEGIGGTIDQSARTVSLILPHGTDVDSLQPTLSVSPYATVSPPAHTYQDFSSPVAYTVTAQNGTTSKTYTVTVTQAALTWYTETFTGFANGGSPSSYLNGSWTGLVHWVFSLVRSDLALNGNAPCMKNALGATLAAVFPNGIGRMSFKMQQEFAGSGGAIHVFANGNPVSGSPFAYSATETGTGEIVVGLPGSVSIMLSNNGMARPKIDDFSWTDGGSTETDRPTIAISAPASGATLTSASTTVSGTAADPGPGASGVKEVWVQLDGAGHFKASGTTSWSILVTGMGDGPHTVTAYAIDNAGNLSLTASVSFTVSLPVDNTPPTAAVSAPASGASLTGTSVSVSGTASDPGTDASGVKDVWVKLDTTGWFKASGTTSWSYTFLSPAEGNRTLSVYAVDNRTNTGSVVTRNFTFTSQASTWPYIVGGVFQPQAGDPQYAYYSSASGLSGNALRSALKTVITSGHSVSSYDGLWTAYATSDRIPSGPNTGKIWDMYSDTGTGQGGPYYYVYGNDQCGNYSGENSCYNREHSWPKSWFNNASPMYSDLVHLVPTDGYVNGKRSNYAFGIVGSASWTSMNGSKLGSRSAQMTTWGCTESVVFEPINAFKGDFARIYFYMCTRYWGTSEGGPMTSNNFRLLGWAQTMLKLWHENDPVSAKETSRNDAILNHQGNRNPFVDYPGLTTIVDFTQ